MTTPAVARYLPHGPFTDELRRRVDLFFAQTGKVPNDAVGARSKTLVLLAWFAASYGLLVFWASTPWAVVALCVSLGLAMAAIGFNIQHDGNHGSYSRRRWLNALAGLGLDALGGSSYVWKWKHNVLHHSNPNIVGSDEDIEFRPLCRMAPSQPWNKLHRFQHLYIWPLYCLMTLTWHFVDDFKNVFRGRIGPHRFPRPRGWSLVGFVAGKLVFATWAFAVPLMLHSLPLVLGCYALASATLSLTLALVFQTAHSGGEAAFPEVDGGRIVNREWAAHQVESALDFAPRNRLITWYVGGLNFQIEHHLFPRVSHLHLRALSPIVEETCREFGVRHRTYPTMRAALMGHARWLHALGREPTAAPS